GTISLFLGSDSSLMRQRILSGNGGEAFSSYIDLLLCLQGKLLQKVSSLIRHFFCFSPHLIQIGRVQLLHFGVDLDESSLNLRDFTDHTNKLGTYAFSFDRFWAGFPLGQNSLQSHFIPVFIGTVGLSHQFLAA